MTKDDYVIICGDFGGAESHGIQDGILNLDEEERIYEDTVPLEFKSIFE